MVAAADGQTGTAGRCERAGTDGSWEETWDRTSSDTPLDRTEWDEVMGWVVRVTPLAMTDRCSALFHASGGGSESRSSFNSGHVPRHQLIQIFHGMTVVEMGSDVRSQTVQTPEHPIRAPPTCRHWTGPLRARDHVSVWASQVPIEVILAAEPKQLGTFCEGTSVCPLVVARTHMSTGGYVRIIFPLVRSPGSLVTRRGTYLNRDRSPRVSPQMRHVHCEDAVEERSRLPVRCRWDRVRVEPG
jgi:hypothetical protein